MWSYFVPTKIDSATSKALQERYANRQVKPVVEAILLHPAFYEGPRMAKPPVVLNAGLLRVRGRYIDTSAWWTIGQQAGQQLFYPPDVGGWDDTRWLDTATFRARWFIAAHAQDASTPTDSPSDPAKLARPCARVLGLADDHADDAGSAQGVRGGAAQAQDRRRQRRDGAAAADRHRPRICRRHELLRLHRLRHFRRAAAAGQGLPEIEPGMPLPAGTGMSRRSFLSRSAGLALAVYGGSAL